MAESLGSIETRRSGKPRSKLWQKHGFSLIFPHAGGVGPARTPMAKTIAIVEDDLDQRENYVDALSAQGYQVEAHANRPTALARFKAQLPDLAILDILMPGIGGLQVSELIRAHRPSLPLIFMSGVGDDKMVRAVKKTGIRLLQKPVNRPRLLEEVRALLPAD